MPASLSAQLYGIEITHTFPKAHFGFINRTTQEIVRPVGTKNRIYGYPTGEDQGQPTVFPVGRLSPAWSMSMVDPVKKPVWVLDNTATANIPPVNPLNLEYMGGILNSETGLVAHSFAVTNLHNQVILVIDPTLNSISFGDQPTYFSPGVTNVTIEAPPDIQVSWNLLGQVAGQE